MAVTCNTLLEQKFFKSIKLMAGASGLNRVISWPYVGQTASVADWVHGGELLFITGVVHETTMLPNLLEECISKKLAGLVVLTGNEYIKEIPENILQRAEEANFPVFSMPWHLKLIDVTRCIIDVIMEERQRSKNITSFLNYLLFANEESEAILINRASMNGVNLPKHNFITLIACDDKEHKLDLEENLCQEVKNYCKLQKIPCFTTLYGNVLILLTGAPTARRARKVMDSLEKFGSYFKEVVQEDVFIAFGSICLELKSLCISYQEAKYTLDIVQHLPGKNCMHYDNLGIYSLLALINDDSKLEYYYRSKLEPLLDEEQTGADDELLYTLKSFLLAQNKVVNASKRMSIHRNTVLYRMHKIQQLLEVDLSNANTCLELLMAILIKEFLDHKQKYN